MNANNDKYIISKISRVIFFLILATTFINKSDALVTLGPSEDANCDYHSLSAATPNVANQGNESINDVDNNNEYVLILKLYVLNLITEY